MRELARYIDHTNLKPDAVEAQIERLCIEAIEYGFASVCVNPFWVRYCALKLQASSIKVCSVVAFPLGAVRTEAKIREAEFCLDDGADELDMVINIGAAKDGKWNLVTSEIEAMVKVAHGRGAILKAILETCLLDKAQIKRSCLAALDGGADFVKTSTGFSSAGATPEDIKLISSVVAGRCGIKASGMIRTTDRAEEMIRLGASRIGTSSSVAIVRGEKYGAKLGG